MDNNINFFDDSIMLKNDVILSNNEINELLTTLSDFNPKLKLDKECLLQLPEPNIAFKKNESYEYIWDMWYDLGFRQFKSGGRKMAFYVVNKTNNKKRLANLSDIEGFNNFDIIEYKNELYILRGQFLYLINGNHIIGTNPLLKNKYKKLNVEEYLNNRLNKYSLPITIVNKSAFYDGEYAGIEFIANSCLYDVKKSLLHAYYMLQLDLSNSILLENYFNFYDDVMNNVVGNVSMDNLSVDKEDLSCWEKLEFTNISDERVLHNKESEIAKNIKRYSFDLPKEKRLKIIDNILKNSTIRKMLETATEIYNSNKKYFDNDKLINGFDYSFIILNYVKALERFMFYKLNKYNLLTEKEKNEATFYDLHKKILHFKDTIIKDSIQEEFVSYYSEVLDRFRKEYRNGFFHRDILDDKNKAQKIISLSLALIILLEIIIKD